MKLNISQLAKDLQVSRNTIYRIIRDLNINPVDAHVEDAQKIIDFYQEEKNGSYQILKQKVPYQTLKEELTKRTQILGELAIQILKESESNEELRKKALQILETYFIQQNGSNE